MPGPRTWITLLLLFSTPLAMAERQQLRNEHFRLSLSPRTPQQIGAFYEARGFPPKAIGILKQQCYLTTYFHNTSPDVIWVELDQWQFLSAGKVIPRLDKAYWKRRWAREGLEQRFQSTFRWTLLPESLDYRPDEREGGNIILPYVETPISLKARLRIVTAGTQHFETVTLEGIRCQQ